MRSRDKQRGGQTEEGEHFSHDSAPYFLKGKRSTAGFNQKMPTVNDR
jgi:hypothetical protein